MGRGVEHAGTAGLVEGRVESLCTGRATNVGRARRTGAARARSEENARTRVRELRFVYREGEAERGGHGAACFA